MSEEDRELTNEERSKLLFERGQKSLEDKNYLEALHYFKLSNKFAQKIVLSKKGILSEEEYEQELVNKINELEKEYNRLLNQIPSNSLTPSDTLYINDSADLPLKKFVLEGKTEQDSTTGRNLCPIVPAQTVKDTSNEITLVSYGNGTYRVYGTATANRTVTIPFSNSINLPNSTLYMHLRNNVLNAKAHAVFVTSNNSSMPAFNSLDRILPSSILVNATLTEIGVQIEGGETVDIIFTPSIELTDEVTEFEPYTRSEYQVLLLLIHKR